MQLSHVMISLDLRINKYSTIVPFLFKLSLLLKYIPKLPIYSYFTVLLCTVNNACFIRYWTTSYRNLLSKSNFVANNVYAMSFRLVYVSVSYEWIDYVKKIIKKKWSVSVELVFPKRNYFFFFLFYTKKPDEDQMSRLRD